ncbi:hypothetical protein V6347_04715 [Acinetobacter baumannii]|uniref:hypothetical protein n=2 Tax=Acinetobacter baumannii TaxID=470 RepID=UPI0005142F0D|nr:hypothetical protein [Acinetobacter baumannii]EHU1559640.1 hypothetical protein [Acinetobacter baumannii]EHU2145058.1 hypothetical protein [Acinetobacter baumannii]EHU2656165.1 hypothetical protein [Acinetobacter baumannii]EHU2724784.1 hypothetical protein [Acinetobacter baumannii]EHU2843093.1 hypothetical protein [Acinetobacter baumannii]
MKPFSIILILFCLSSTCLHAEKLGRERMMIFLGLIENSRTAEQNLQNYLSGIHSVGQVSFKHQMRITDLLCDVGKAQKPMIEFMELNKERFGLKDEDVMNIFPLDRQKLQEELEELKGTPYECGKQSYKHLL